MRRRLLTILLAGSTSGVALGSVAHHFWPASPIVDGLSIGDRFVPEGKTPSAWLLERQRALAERKVHLRYEDEVFEATLGELGVSVDVQATLEQAEIVGHRGTLFRRLREARAASKGQIDVPLVWYTNREKARLFLEKLVPHFSRAPENARLDLVSHQKVAEVDGQDLAIESSIDRIAEGTHEDEETIYLVVQRIGAKITVNDLANVDVTKVVAAFETTFVTWGEGAGRAVNIRNAASKIDGTILMPGEVLSFNDKVGPRTAENGFTMAPEIQGDELVTGYGGGTCQVSSTLYAAAVYGALDVLDRQNHSRPSAYTQMGLDATVSYPKVDLKIKNTMSYPIMIHAYLPKPTAIRVELLGGDPVAKVAYKYGIGHTEDFVRRVRVMGYLAPGTKIRRQKGTRGYDVTSIITIHYFDGRVEERKYFSGYRPSPEVFWVSPGYNESDLPPLPEHSKGLESALQTAQRADETYPM